MININGCVGLDYFREKEFEYLDLKLEEKDWVKVNFLLLNYIAPLRVLINKKMIITSVKRSEQHNREVGGHPRSAHLFKGKAGAVDFIIKNLTLEDVVKSFNFMKSVPLFGSFIWYDDRKSFHVSINNNRTASLKVYDGLKSEYLKWENYFKEYYPHLNV